MKKRELLFPVVLEGVFTDTFACVIDNVSEENAVSVSIKLAIVEIHL